MIIDTKISKICVFGDSIAWGACDYEKGGWVERLKTDFLKSNDIDVYNFGVCGNTTANLLDRFEIEAAIMKPGMIIFAIGINDTKYLSTSQISEINLEDFKNNILMLIDKAEKISKGLIFVGLTPVDETKTKPRIHREIEKFYDNKIIQNYDTLIYSLCKEKGITYIRLFDLLNNSDLEDGLHPNSNGHKIIFDKIKSVIEELIK